MKQLNKRIARLEMPDRFKRLPISDEGYPVPYFVGWVDGRPDFRLADPEKLAICYRHRKCWLCSEQLGKFLAFTIGPMCAINRNSAEPPSHYDCALYACMACPFLTQPRMRRNEHDISEHNEMPGIGLKRNPGVQLIWVTHDYWARRVGRGVLFTIGDPVRVEFYAEGRKATREEIMHSITTGMPHLRELAELGGPDDIADLDQRYNKAMQLLPAA
jgi:hypothetical protein